MGGQEPTPVGRSHTPPKAGATGERWRWFFAPLSVLLACGLPSWASAELGGGRAQPCLCVQVRSCSDGPNPSLSGHLRGSLFHAQVLPLSCLGSVDSCMEHSWDGVRAGEWAGGWFRAVRQLGPPHVLAGTGQPKALGTCCHRGAALQRPRSPALGCAPVAHPLFLVRGKVKLWGFFWFFFVFQSSPLPLPL